jgi:hypothetical protein
MKFMKAYLPKSTHNEWMIYFDAAQGPINTTLPFQKQVVELSLMEELLQVVDNCADQKQQHPVTPQKSHCPSDCSLAKRSSTFDIIILTAKRHPSIQVMIAILITIVTGPYLLTIQMIQIC